MMVIPFFILFIGGFLGSFIGLLTGTEEGAIISVGLGFLLIFILIFLSFFILAPLMIYEIYKAIMAYKEGNDKMRRLVQEEFANEKAESRWEKIRGS